MLQWIIMWYCGCMLQWIIVCNVVLLYISWMYATMDYCVCNVVLLYISCANVVWCGTMDYCVCNVVLLYISWMYATMDYCV